MTQAPRIEAAVTAPSYGKIGRPTQGSETAQRVDARPNDFATQVEMHGHRVAWSRMAICPCEPLNDQTEQSNPNCPLCTGSGYIYFGPPGGNDFAKVGALTDCQTQIIEEQNACVIKALLMSAMKEDSPWDKIGGVRAGAVAITVVPENKLAYYDRLTNLDATLVYQELLRAPQAGQPLQTRYLIDGGVNLLRTVDKSYKAGSDFQIVRGRVVFPIGSGPTAGEQVSIHYLTHPTYLVMDFPHVTRGMPIRARTKNPDTPEGNYADFPLAAVGKLEFLVQRAGKPKVEGSGGIVA